MSPLELSKSTMILRHRTGPLDTRSWAIREEDYLNKLDSRSPVQIAEVLRDLEKLCADRLLIPAEAQILKRAKHFMLRA